MPNRLLRRTEVLARVPFSKSTLYAKIAAGEFPASISLSSRAVAWDEKSIDSWIASRIAASAGEHKPEASK